MNLLPDLRSFIAVILWASRHYACTHILLCYQWPWLRHHSEIFIGLDLKLNEVETKAYEDFLIVSAKIWSLN